jgi:hypothetical protein
MWSDPWKDVDDEEIVYDEYAREWIPIWIYERRVGKRELERLQREYHERNINHMVERAMIKLRNHLLTKKEA